MNALPLLLYLMIPPSEGEVRTAIEKGIPRLEQAEENYTKNRQCYSCHHQGLPMMALHAARQKGFRVDDRIAGHQVRFTLDSFEPKLAQIVKGQSIPGGNTMAAYALHTLAEVNHPADKVTEALAEYLLGRQKEDGSWPAVMPRPPSEGSRFTNTALAIRTLKKYTDAKSARTAKAIEQGRMFLEENEPKDTEDAVFRLIGLVAGGSSPEKIAQARKSLLAQQRADGSWSQLPSLVGDAYATGSVLVALAEAGLPTTSREYQRGVRWLLMMQHESGGWIVKTRSRPVQTFFDNGDPGGKSQFISTAASGWAMLALTQTIPAKARR